MIEEVTSSQIADQRFGHVGCFEVELLNLLCQRQLGDGHLVFDRTRRSGPPLNRWRAGPYLSDLSVQQVTPSRQIASQSPARQ